MVEVVGEEKRDFTAEVTRIEAQKRSPTVDLDNRKENRERLDGRLATQK